MGEYSQEKVRSLTADCRNQELTTTARGRAFEQLFCYLLLEVPGLSVQTDTVNPFHSEEIDIAVANRGDASSLACFPNLLLVEAKNWKEPVDSSSVGVFIQKLTERHIDLGILVAANGVTGDAKSLQAAYHKAAAAQTLGHRVLLITFDDILSLRTAADFTDLLVRRLLGLIASGTFQLN
jgi:hypothetical protein